VQDDRESLVGIARRSFAAFKPGFVMVESADPVGAWPDTGAEMRQVVGKLEDLRRLSTPPELSVVPRRDTGFYGDYRQIHDRHVAEHPAHARRARCETRRIWQHWPTMGLSTTYSSWRMGRDSRG
jgi:hypothetical protein